MEQNILKPYIKIDKHYKGSYPPGLEEATNKVFQVSGINLDTRKNNLKVYQSMAYAILDSWGDIALSEDFLKKALFIEMYDILKTKEKNLPDIELFNKEIGKAAILTYFLSRKVIDMLIKEKRIKRIKGQQLERIL